MQSSADAENESFDENELDEDWAEECEEPSSSGAAGGGSKQEQKGAQATDGGPQKSGGQNKRVTGLRDLTDKLGLTMPAGESGRDWEAELRKKNLARIGPFDFGNSDKEKGDKGSTPQGEMATPSTPTELEEALRKSTETRNIEQPAGNSAPSQGKEFPFSEAFQEATEVAWSTEYPGEAREGSEGAEAGSVEREAGGVAAVEVAAVRRSGNAGDGQEQVEEEIVIRVEETEDSGAGMSIADVRLSCPEEAILRRMMRRWSPLCLTSILLISCSFEMSKQVIIACVNESLQTWFYGPSCRCQSLLDAPRILGS